MIVYFSLVLFALQIFSATSIEPFHVPTDGAKWFGNDGKWSTITVRLGNPVQAVFLLAGTGSSITTAVSSVWCNDPRSGYSCVDRGRQFDTSKSTTWQPIGLYGDLERPQLDEEYLKWTSLDLGYGAFGRDTVKIEDSQGRIVTLDNQTIAVVNDTTQLLGSLGLGLKTRSFKSDEAYPSFISVLANQSLIPSRSWGYTAGNYFESQIPMDLILGGSNLGRYSPNNISFQLDANQEPTVNLGGLTVSATGSAPWGPGKESLMLEPALMQIDSTTPFIWLPEETCRQFERALGLTWNSTTNLYLLNNETVHNTLVQLNLTFAFSLSPEAGSSDEVVIEVPYTSLDLEISFPYVNTTSFVKYFPIKRATESQYTLGRAFLQNAYLVVDYERGNFSVNQALYPPQQDNIVTIQKPSNILPPPSDKKLSLGAKIGIGVAGALGVLGIIAIIFFITRKKKIEPLETESKPPSISVEEIYPNISEAAGDSTFNKSMGMRPEMPGDIRAERSELPAFNQEPAELQANNPSSAKVSLMPPSDKTMDPLSSQDSRMVSATNSGTNTPSRWVPAAVEYGTAYRQSEIVSGLESVSNTASRRQSGIISDLEPSTNTLSRR